MIKITLKRGDTFSRPVKVTENDRVTPINLTDFTIKMQVRDKNDGLIFKIDTTNGITITNPTGGEYLIEYSDTDNFSIGQHFADIEYIKDSKTISTQTFCFDVVKDITRC